MLYSKKYPTKRLGLTEGGSKMHDGKGKTSLGDDLWTLMDADDSGVYTLRNGAKIDHALGTDGTKGYAEEKGKRADTWKIEGDLNSGYTLVSVDEKCHAAYEPSSLDAWTCSKESKDE